MINIQTFLNCFRFVIISENERFTAHITFAFNLCRIEQHMISCSTSNTSTATGHSIDYILIWNVDINRIIQLLFNSIKGIFQCFRLRNCSWETIQNIAFFTVSLLNSINDEIADQFVRYKKALIHVFFGFCAQFCTILNVGSEDISG